VFFADAARCQEEPEHKRKAPSQTQRGRTFLLAFLSELFIYPRGSQSDLCMCRFYQHDPINFNIKVKMQNTTQNKGGSVSTHHTHSTILCFEKRFVYF